MGLGNAVFAGWIAWVSLFGDNISLAGDAALQLRLNVSATSLFERISATAREDCTSDHE
ncbi:MAG: hypothetical protein QOE81_1033 [Verrucomicrobiota bacterium]|jgi:hypothetical protein